MMYLRPAAGHGERDMSHHSELAESLYTTCQLLVLASDVSTNLLLVIGVGGVLKEPLSLVQTCPCRAKLIVHLLITELVCASHMLECWCMLLPISRSRFDYAFCDYGACMGQPYAASAFDT